MVEVHKNLFVGSDLDAGKVTSDWAVLHAAKEPWHRRALGYKTAGAPHDHPDYLLARIGTRELALNLVDADHPRWIPAEVVKAGMDFIAERLAAGDKVLCHCNRGESRGPGIAFLYLMDSGILPRSMADALAAFRERYPLFVPGEGMRGFIENCFQ